ncbi:MAG: threonine/serine exporter family protein [Clostridia bacterium]|nr:threonine/serine exporter family protein [Clostridia bacterium]
MVEFIKYFILAFVGSIAPAMVINIEKRILLWAGLGGALGFCIALALHPDSLSLSVTQTFVGTVVVGIYSELMAKYLKAPSTVFCVPGIFPLVPGVTAYQTVQSLVENKTQQATIYALNTVFKAFTIAFGIMIVTALFRFVRKAVRRPRQSS